MSNSPVYQLEIDDVLREPILGLYCARQLLVVDNDDQTTLQQRKKKKDEYSTVQRRLNKKIKVAYSA